MARKRISIRPSARRRTTAWTSPIAGAHEPVLPDLGDLYRRTTVLAR